MLDNNFLINHSRFKKPLKKEDLKKYSSDAKRIFDFPHASYKYYEFFTDYAKKNYTLKKLDCLCHKHNSLLISKTDRYGVEFKTVICKECGLIRASEMFTSEDLAHFYQNYYRNISDDSPGFKDPLEYYNTQALSGKSKIELIKKYMRNINPDISIIDVGGGTGGVLENFKPSKNLYLADFFPPYLKVAKGKGINVIVGGLDKINFKPDLIILSNVIEHWNEFENEIKNLIKVQKINETINYIEFPGVDSLKYGRRAGDLLGDIHIPHVFYFSSYVFENIMNRYGFEKIYIDSHIRGIFKYTGKKSNLINFFSKACEDLKLAEKRRRYEAFKRLIKKILPQKIIVFLKTYILR